MIEFGERVHARLAVGAEPSSGYAAKMIEGIYVGHQARTGSLMIMTADGVVKAKTFNKMTAEDRWNKDFYENLKGKPWDLRPGMVREPRAAGTGEEATQALSNVRFVEPRREGRCELNLAEAANVL